VALIKSISGIRGTIGGEPGKSLTPLDIVKFTAAFGTVISEKNKAAKIVIGRDGRISGGMVRDLVVNTLTSLGIDVVDLGLSTTPTVEVAVPMEKADGGIIITASHNPKEWNALKLLNNKGEFISGDEGAYILEKAASESFHFAPVEKLGNYIHGKGTIERHINAVVNYPLVDTEAIRSRNYTVVLDAINSTGAMFIPPLLNALGVENVIVINGEVNGRFAHNP
jgi:phosphomannomutase